LTNTFLLQKGYDVVVAVWRFDNSSLLSLPPEQTKKQEKNREKIERHRPPTAE